MVETRRSSVTAAATTKRAPTSATASPREAKHFKAEMGVVLPEEDPVKIEGNEFEEPQQQQMPPDSSAPSDSPKEPVDQVPDLPKKQAETKQCSDSLMKRSGKAQAWGKLLSQCSQELTS